MRSRVVRRLPRYPSSVCADALPLTTADAHHRWNMPDRHFHPTSMFPLHGEHGRDSHYEELLLPSSRLVPLVASFVWRRLMVGIVNPRWGIATVLAGPSQADSPVPNQDPPPEGSALVLVTGRLPPPQRARHPGGGVPGGLTWCGSASLAGASASMRSHATGHKYAADPSGGHRRPADRQHPVPRRGG
jgi:hypothetical protein